MKEKKSELEINSIRKRNANYFFLYLKTHNIHLIKEIGMIPYYLHRMYNFKGTILTYQNGSYPFLKKYCKGLKLDFIKKSEKLNKFSMRFILKYLILNAKKIDFLNLITPHYDNMIFGILYKLYNKNGFIYLKMDVDQTSKKKYLSYMPNNFEYYGKGFLDSIIYQIKKKIISIFLNLVDLISFETMDLAKFFRNKYLEFKKKIIYIPNGIDDHFVRDNGIGEISFSEKENILLTVGKIGHETKSSEILLEAISKIKNIKDWKFFLIGPIEEKFLLYIKKYFKENPHLKEKVKFIGEILDRKRLFTYYQKSKIYCSTSKYESFGITLVESSYFGNYIVSSDFTSAREITMYGALGTLFEFGNSDKLAEILQELIINQHKLEKLFPKIVDNAKKKFSWSIIIGNLYQNIRSRYIKIER